MRKLPLGIDFCHKGSMTERSVWLICDWLGLECVVRCKNIHHEITGTELVWIRFIFLFPLQVRSATAPVQQACIFHNGCHSLHPQQTRLLFLLQLSSWDDQSTGDSVFVERLIIPPLSGMMTVCMLIASFRDHFSTSFTSTKNSLRGRFNIRVWLDVKMRPNTATMWHLDAIISN